MSRLSRAVREIKKLREKAKETYPISEETAISQIVEILDYYDIPIERFEKTGVTETAGENIIDSLVDYFRSGKLQTTKDKDTGELIIIQKTGGGSTIRYREVRAKHKRIMDKYDPAKEQYARMYAFLGALCGEGADLIEQLKTGGGSNDLAVAEIIGILFLAV